MLVEIVILPVWVTFELLPSRPFDSPGGLAGGSASTIEGIPIKVIKTTNKYLILFLFFII